jgi:hypothetical protein
MKQTAVEIFFEDLVLKQNDMKQGTKCRLKYMPTIEYKITDIDEAKQIAFVTAWGKESFPVPLSELEPIIEWPKNVGGFSNNTCKAL